MAYSLSNKCAKNLCKRTVLVQLIIKNVVTCFFGTQCSFVSNFVTVFVSSVMGKRLYNYRRETEKRRVP